VTRRYRSNPAVIPVPFPVPLPITEEVQKIKPPSPTAIQFTCFGIPIYQHPTVPSTYAVVNVVSRNVFYGCSGDTCFEGVEGIDIKAYVFLPVNLFAYIFACEAPTPETSEEQETQTIIVITENTPLVNVDRVTQVNQVVQGQFADKSEVLSISYGDVNIQDANYLSFIRTELQIATKFSLSFCDRIFTFKTPFEIAVAKTIYLAIEGKERPKLDVVVDFMQTLQAEISSIIETDYQEIEPNGKLTNTIGTPVQNQLPLQVLPSVAFGQSYGLSTDGILTQTELETEIGEQLYTDNIVFETELEIQQS